MEQLKLSIIIPVYNVEEYLLECVHSFDLSFSQGYEIILVDDGSTDGSSVLCDRIKTDMGEGVTVIHQQNGGLSAARNSGLEVAKGTYIAFVDSDDRIASGSLAKIIKWTNTADADICFMQGEKIYEDGSREDMGDDIQFAEVHNRSAIAVMEHIASRPKFPGSVCTKLFKKDFLDKHHFRFPKDRRHSEDLGFVRDCLIAARTFDVLDFAYYQYRQNRRGSITNSITSKTFWDMSLFVEESARKLMPNGACIDQISKLAMSFASYEYIIMLWRYRWLEQQERQKALAWLSKFRFVLKYGKSKVSKVVYYMSLIMGLKGTAIILDLYKTKDIKNILHRCAGGVEEAFHDINLGKHIAIAYTM